jgi:acyl-CoA synthetase (AMP-forming)/AMP-acid ligase II
MRRAAVTGWNIADVLEAVAEEVPEAIFVSHGDRELTWGEADRRADRILAFLQERGHQPRDHVAQYLRNCPEYLESMVATLKGAMVPVNTNYRYGADELVYLWDNADITAVVFHASYSSIVESMRDRVPNVRTWLRVDDGSDGDSPSWVDDYEAVAAMHPGVPSPVSRSGDDLILLYTGGTTGMPKGVMWRQDDLFMALGAATSGRYGDTQDLDFARSRVARPGRVHLPAAPLMHGAGCFTCLPFLTRGGSVALLEGSGFSAQELLSVIERRGVTSVSWVGEVFARPVLDVLRAEPDRWDLSSWRTVTSGGMAFTDQTKRGLSEALPQLLIADVYGSSEALSAGRSISSADKGVARSGTFRAGGAVKVLREDGSVVPPGSSEAGLLAFSGRQPLGYWKDEDKTAATFRIVDGRRWSVPGDMATVSEDGTITLIGRGSTCINTGGEKVFPEEVEDALREHPQVADAIVVGLPDPTFGERVAAVVQLEVGAQLTDDEVQEPVATRLARYKIPRSIRLVELAPRGANGKPDLSAARGSFDPVDTA